MDAIASSKANQEIVAALEGQKVQPEAKEKIEKEEE